MLIYDDRKIGNHGSSTIVLYLFFTEKIAKIIYCRYSLLGTLDSILQHTGQTSCNDVIDFDKK
jgi:hypothetical protein